MKKIAIIIATLMLSTAAFAQLGEKSVGVSLNYGTEIEGVGLGVKFNYGITDALRLQPNFTYFFKKDHVSMWDINLDVNYLIPIADQLKVYPIGGLSIAGAKLHSFSMGGYPIPSESTSKFGINLGAGIEYDIDNTWAINLDLKYRIMSKIDQGIIGIGCAYKF